ncbi:hypothetical protein [Candidatus Magnetomonas plexicatena]
MTDDISICTVCAYREHCNKKFSISGKDIRCVDFTRDISIKETTEKKM